MMLRRENEPFIDERLVLELTMPDEGKSLQTAYRGRKPLIFNMTAAIEDPSGAQIPLDDFKAQPRMQIVSLTEASSRGGDFIAEGILLSAANEASGLTAIRFDRHECPAVRAYTGAALIPGAKICFYYNPEKNWGSVYSLASEVLEEGYVRLRRSDKYPVPPLRTVCFYCNEFESYKIADLVRMEEAAAMRVASADTGNIRSDAPSSAEDTGDSGLPGDLGAVLAQGSGGLSAGTAQQLSETIAQMRSEGESGDSAIDSPAPLLGARQFYRRALFPGLKTGVLPVVEATSDG